MKVFLTVAVCLTLAGVSLAQAGPQPPVNSLLPDSPAPVAVVVDWDALPQNPEPATTQPATNKKGKSIFGLMPNNKTVEPDEHPGPMSAGQKLKLTVDYFSPFTIAFVAVDAAWDQAIDAKSGYGQGAEGYGKRYGADFATGLTHTLFVTGVFPSLLHQDPRYFRKGDGGAGSRIGYALTRVVVTRQDSDRNMFNFSEVLGSAASAGIAGAYYPEEDRTASGFAIRTGLQIAVESGFNVLREFYPDISRKIFKRK